MYFGKTETVANLRMGMGRFLLPIEDFYLINIILYIIISYTNFVTNKKKMNQLHHTKSSGEKRRCVDCRKLNQQTVTDPFLIPNVGSQSSTLAGGIIFTTLDLSNGFLQIPLSPKAKDQAAFVTETPRQNLKLPILSMSTEDNRH